MPHDTLFVSVIDHRNSSQQEQHGIGQHHSLQDFLVDEHIAAGRLEPVLADYPPPEAGLYVVRPPGEFAPRKVRALIDILVERFGGESTAPL